MSEDADNRPGDVWITINSTGEARAKYYSGVAYAVYPNGVFGQAIAETKFNLTAYVRDMIAEAMK